MADPIDTDAERDDACHCRDVVSVPGPKLGVTYHFSDCRVDEISALCDEVDRLRDLLAKALPWIDPNDRHEDYLLTVAIREALGEPT